MSLKNLNKIASEAQKSFLNYKKEEIELSDNFKKQFTQIIEDDGKQKVSFSKHTTVIFTSKELTITFPNQWFYIASYFVDYLVELFKYKNNFNVIFKEISAHKVTVAEIKRTKQIPQNIQELINKYFSLDQDKIYFQKFLSVYDWWYGSKTIDRNDYFVSPILELANVVNNSQSYVADLAYHLSVNPNLFKLLNESKISEFQPKQFGKESLPISAKKYIEEKYTGRFVYKALKYFYDLDKLNNIILFFFKNNQLEYTSIKDNEIKLTSIFKTSQGLLSKDELSFNDGKTRFFEEVIFQLNDENYYLSTEWTYSKDSRLDLDNFKALIEKYYPNYSIYTKNEVHFLSSKIDISKLASKDIFNINTFQKDCEFSGLNYKTELITRYIASLATKPFVLLSGLSGSGKTKLAQAFAQWICESEEQYALIPVGADWTNREPILGYPNALKDNEYVKPDNDALDLLLRANKDENRPYFLILDEMNLSHVERYFADFLSTMESKNSIPLHKLSSEKNGIPNTIKLPKNLFIVGTVNIDETTYMFSPKVLDRANTIEFRVSDTDISDFLKNPKDIDLDKLNGKGANMAVNFVEIATATKGGDKIEEDYKLTISQDVINNLFKELQKSGAEFGYRTAFEISKLIFKLEEFGLSDKNDKLDIAIMQKMLPKLHGSRTKLTRTLKPLAKLCLVDVNDKFDKEYFENFENIDFKKDVNIKYKLSFEKIMRMYKNAIENGFASYAEA